MTNQVAYPNSKPKQEKQILLSLGKSSEYILKILSVARIILLLRIAIPVFRFLDKINLV